MNIFRNPLVNERHTKQRGPKAAMAVSYQKNLAEPATPDNPLTPRAARGHRASVAVHPAAPAPSKSKASSRRRQKTKAAAEDLNDDSRSEEDRIEKRRLFVVWVLSSVAFISVLVPLALVLIPLWPARAARRTPRMPQQTLVPDLKEDIVKESHLSYDKFCGQKRHIDNHTGLRGSTNRYTRIEQPFQYREIICVFDTKYYRTEAVYYPENVPYDFCSSLVYSSLAVFFYRVQWKRPNLDADFMQRLRALQLRHRGNHVPIYVTLGGEPEDNANFTKVLRHRERLLRFTHNLRVFLLNGAYEGLHLDWDHPQGLCGERSDTENLRNFLHTLRAQWTGRMVLSVPPAPHRLRHYGIERILPMLEHVIVTTHRLGRGRVVVGCSGGGDDTARVMRAVRKRFPPEWWKRFIYSVSVGAHTFTTADAPYLGAPSTGPSSFDYYTRQPGKTRYDLVCQLTRTEKAAGAECDVGYLSSTDASQVTTGRRDVKVAAFAAPNEIQTRMRRAYAYNLGDTPIAVYDIDLDDFEGKCPGGTLSPQVEAYATATHES
ncbi:probable chitinase 2 isoform X5 [Dermacentor albipictus]|uniref:probable chitinase 2 isoform X5 n=1 Tax=Dermacentor albipictus TaxID=60249 RepID=UPI0038FC6CF7